MFLLFRIDIIIECYSVITFLNSNWSVDRVRENDFPTCPLSVIVPCDILALGKKAENV